MKKFFRVATLMLATFLISTNSVSAIEYKDIPIYPNRLAYSLNNNEPYFLNEKGIQWDGQPTYFTPLDKKKRVGKAYARVTASLIRTSKRKPINNVIPTGWKQKKYSFIKGKYLWNRCHLVAHSLCGEDANRLNLMTGTKDLNNVGMIPYEMKIYKAVKNKGLTVRYRVTPIFKGNELVARGLVMEAYSVEDRGKTVKFNVFVQNTQNRVKINYLTGDSKQIN